MPSPRARRATGHLIPLSEGRRRPMHRPALLHPVLRDDANFACNSVTELSATPTNVENCNAYISKHEKLTGNCMRRTGRLRIRIDAPVRLADATRLGVRGHVGR